MQPITQANIIARARMLYAKKDLDAARHQCNALNQKHLRAPSKLLMDKWAIATFQVAINSIKYFYSQEILDEVSYHMAYRHISSIINSISGDSTRIKVWDNDIKYNLSEFKLQTRNQLIKDLGEATWSIIYIKDSKNPNSELINMMHKYYSIQRQYTNSN